MSAGLDFPDEGGGRLPLVQRKVTRLEFDYRASLLFDDGAYLAIGGRCRLSRDQETALIEPERPDTVSPLLALLRSTVTMAHASADGLVLQFGDDVILTVPPDQQYEAWEAVGPGPGSKAWRIVCMPGGGLATWCQVSESHGS